MHIINIIYGNEREREREGRPVHVSMTKLSTLQDEESKIAAFAFSSLAFA